MVIGRYIERNPVQAKIEGREEEIGIIEKSTINGKPVGSEEFLNLMVDNLGITINTNTQPKGGPCKRRN